ncbi:MAG: hypothetical protein LC795_17290 [Acidobacteria bacterium]|nr:hypothetical protein [Acidobacteriota bacterium]
MKRYCQWCQRRLRLRDVRCPYCRDPAFSWLHATAVVVAAATVLFFLMRAV